MLCWFRVCWGSIECVCFVFTASVLAASSVRFGPENYNLYKSLYLSDTNTLQKVHLINLLIAGQLVCVVSISLSHTQKHNQSTESFYLLTAWHTSHLKAL